MQKIALLSVYDKTNIVKFAENLIKLGIKIISSGGTTAELKKHGVDCVEVSAWTGSDETRDGLVKTLHPKIYKSILLGANDPALIAENIEPIVLVACNLYPFEDKRNIDAIDIGGPTMIFAAAKGWKLHGGVIPVISHDQYDAVITELQNGKISQKLGDNLFADATSYVAYDRAMVAGTYQTSDYPKYMAVPLKNSDIEMRYCENYHQNGTAYINPLEQKTGRFWTANN